MFPEGAVVKLNYPVFSICFERTEDVREYFMFQSCIFSWNTSMTKHNYRSRLCHTLGDDGAPGKAAHSSRNLWGHEEVKYKPNPSEFVFNIKKESPVKYRWVLKIGNTNIFADSPFSSRPLGRAVFPMLLLLRPSFIWYVSVARE